jgi:hypothetical protein
MKCSHKGCATEPTRRIGLTFYCEKHAPRHVQTSTIEPVLLEAAKRDAEARTSRPALQTAGHVPSPGDRVLYTLGSGPSKGQRRPALVVRLVDNRPDHDTPIVLRVFTDPVVDGLEDMTTSAAYSATFAPGSWSRRNYDVPRVELEVAAASVSTSSSSVIVPKRRTSVDPPNEGSR